MNFTDLNAASLIASLLIAATPILFAAIGELVAEKSGVLNLGVEGMMIIGAVSGFAIAVETGSPAIGFVAAAFAGALLAALFAALTQLLLSNQVATGLALTLFGLGLAALIGHSYNGIKPPSTPKLDLGADVPGDCHQVRSPDVWRCLRRRGRGISIAGARTPMDRRHDRRGWLDCAGACRVWHMAAVSRSAGCLSFWRCQRVAA